MCRLIYTCCVLLLALLDLRIVGKAKMFLPTNLYKNQRQHKDKNDGSNSLNQGSYCL